MAAQPEAPAAAPDGAAPAAPASDAPVTRIGRVVEVLGRGAEHTTFARMDACGVEAWVAGPAVELEVGQHVEMVGGQPMVDFHSDALDRTFDALLLVDAWRLSENEPVCAAAPPAEAMRFGTILQIRSPGSYVFLQLDDCGERVWVAGPERDGLEVGGMVATPIGLEKKDFFAATMNMRFETIFFVDKIRRAKSRPPCSP